MTELRADCTRCFGLCCVVPAFAASADFAIDKPAGDPCPNLRADFRCGIHAELRDRGFPGCTVYDCFGAGQHVAQETFGGRDWRAHPELAEPMFAAFGVMRELHELLWYLTDALARPAAGPLRAELSRARAETERHTELAADALAALDIDAHRSAVDGVLSRASELVRAGTGGRRPRDADDLAGANLRGADFTGGDLAGANLRGADLMGRDLRRADLRGASLRGAYLIGAELAGADLRLADVIGADLRGADLRGADLGTALYLTQFQVNAARGDASTTLPATVDRPAHWTPERSEPSTR